jgi:hypothetical protein
MYNITQAVSVATQKNTNIIIVYIFRQHISKPPVAKWSYWIIVLGGSGIAPCWRTKTILAADKLTDSTPPLGIVCLGKGKYDAI